MRRLILLFALLFGHNSFVYPSENESDFHEEFLKIKEIVIYCPEEKGQVKDFSGVVIKCKDIANEPELVKKLSHYLDKEITIALIEQLKKDLYSHFVEKGKPFTAVTFPENQDITDGIIKIHVIESKIGKIKSKGAKYFSNNKIKDYLSAQQGDTIDPDTILKDMVYINQNPFRSTSLYYEKGKEKNTTDIILETKDVFPMRVYGGYDFTGYNVAGESRYFVGFNVGTLYFVDHEIDYQYMFNPNISKWQGHNATYQIPFFWKTKIKLYGNYIETRPDIFANGDSRGRSYMLSGKYLIPLIYQKFRSSFILSYEFKRANNFLNFYDKTETDNYVDISQFLFAWEGANFDKYGKTAFGIYTYFSFGNMTRYNKNYRFNIERPGATNKYIYSFARIDRETTLPRDFKWILSAKGQLSSNKLLPSEEFSIGGYLTVRGYNENALIGDNGFYIKNEIHAPSFRVFKKGVDKLELLAFLDYGGIWDADVNIENRKSSSLLSCGPGMRYSAGDNLTLRFDYGFQLKKVLTNEGITSRAHVGVVLSY